MGENGEVNLKYVFDVAKSIGEQISETSIIINKSTVPVGTAEKVNDIITNLIKDRGIKCDFHVVSNPEFLKEGDAIRDFMYPDRIVIGTDNEYAEKVMRELYLSFSMKNDRLFVMGIKEAELTKYAANAMLATKISFINEIAALCDKLDIDVDAVRKGIGSDKRIGYSFIYPGCGYGGSCFPKDVNALIHTSIESGIDPVILKAVEARNTIQKELMVNQIFEEFGNDLSGLKFSLWGLSFKPGTNDIREAPSLVIIEKLINAGAIIYAHDPVSISEVEKVMPKPWKNKLFLNEGDQYSIIDDSDALLLITEWKLYRNPDFLKIKEMMKFPTIFDGRNQYSPKQLSQLGFTYKGIGR
jgi:UDPglucose 6-dehydrogenase